MAGHGALSLVGEHRRGHGSSYAAVVDGRVDVERLRTGLTAVPLPRAAERRLVLTVDITCWLRPEAQTSPEPILCHARGRGKRPGHHDPGLALLNLTTTMNHSGQLEEPHNYAPRLRPTERGGRTYLDLDSRPSIKVIMPYRKPRNGSELPEWKQDYNTRHRKIRARVEHAASAQKHGVGEVQRGHLQHLHARRLAESSLSLSHVHRRGRLLG